MESINSALKEAFELLKAGEADKALKIAMLELDDDPTSRMAAMLVGRAFLDLKRPGAAEKVLKCAVEISPDEPLLWSYLGLAYNMSYQPELAEEAMLKALNLSPRYQLAMDAMSLIRVNLGDPDGAIRWVNKSLAAGRKDKEHGFTSSDVLQNAGFAYLLRGDYKEGWPLYNLGLGDDGQRKERIYGSESRWDGTKGQTVVAYGEQGLGDEIAFASALPDLLRDCKVIIECDHRLEGLFKRSFNCPVYGTRYRVAHWVKDHKIDARVSFAQLMESYRNKKADFPGTPYLVPDPERRKWWKGVLAQYPGKKIGVTWNGGIPITGHRKRSVDVSEILKLQGKDTFVSLEYNDPGDCGMLNFSKYLTKDYDDTAALVAELDHVITVTTAIVDLCGAIGKTCDVLVPTVPHWRYGLIGDTLPWYKGAKLFRQLPGEPWAKTVKRYASFRRLRSETANSLRSVAAQHYPPRVEAGADYSSDLEAIADLKTGTD